MSEHISKEPITFELTKENFYVVETHRHWSKSTITIVPSPSWRLVLYGGRRYNWHENQMPDYLDFSHAVLFMRDWQWRLVIPAFDHPIDDKDSYYDELQILGLMQEKDRVYSRPNFEIRHFNMLSQEDRHFSMTYGLGVE